MGGDPRLKEFARWAVLAVLLGPSAACDTGERTPSEVTGGPKQPAQPHPVDRLAPGELGASSRMVFGFPIPQGLRVDAEFHDAVHLSGKVALEALARYVRDRVVVSHVEVMGARWVFPNARIKGGDPQRVYRLDLVRDGGLTRLVIRDKTPPPTVQGISEAERWKRAGLTPDGKPLNLTDFE